MDEGGGHALAVRARDVLRQGAGQEPGSPRRCSLLCHRIYIYVHMCVCVRIIASSLACSFSRVQDLVNVKVDRCEVRLEMGKLFKVPLQ
jgi:hypothetical protein